MTDQEESKLRGRVKKAEDYVRSLTERLKRQENAAGDFHQIAEMLSGMRDVDHVLLQLQSEASDYPCGTMPGAVGIKQQGWKHAITWRLFIRRYNSKAHCDRAGTSLLEVIKDVFSELKLPMPAGLEKLAQQIDQ